MKINNHPTAIDLCSGCGGFSLGAQNIGFNVRAAFEIDTAANYTYKSHIADHDDMSLMARDITTFDPTELCDEIDAIFAGPPCQPYSDAQANPFDGDPEETVLFAVTNWIDILTPAVFAIENVGGLKRNHQDVMGRLIDTLRETGYTVGSITLNAADYGVPQTRERVFIVGTRSDLPVPGCWEPPQTRMPNTGQTTFRDLGVPVDGYKTAGEAIGDLPQPLAPQKPSNDPIHSTPHCDDHRVIPDVCPTWVTETENGYELGDLGGLTGDVCMPPNHVETDHDYAVRKKYSEWELGYCGNRTTDRRLHPDQAAPTMTVSRGTPPVHYRGKAPQNDKCVEDVRRLTVREVARLQTFPDSWAFAGTQLDQYRQAGNAVPPLLASHISEHLLSTVAGRIGYDEFTEIATTP